MFALLYPETIARLILEDPLGLEDYKKFVPAATMEAQYKKELNASYASYKKYQMGYYPKWKPEYEQYVKAQAEALNQKDFSSVAWVNALIYQMIYDEPVVYDFTKLAMPVLLIIGKEDRTFIGKDMVPKEKQKLYGDFQMLGRKAHQIIKNSELIELPGVGHIPHIQSTALFNMHVFKFLHQH